MTKMNTAVTFHCGPDGLAETVDLSKTGPLPLEKMSGAQLITAYNAVCDVAFGTGGIDESRCRKVIKFENRQVGEKRIAALHSSIVAYLGGIRQKTEAADNAVKSSEEKALAKATSKKAAASKARGTKTPKTTTKGAGRKNSFADDSVITKLVEGNPKREGSKQHEQWGAYRDGTTVGKVREKLGKEANIRMQLDVKRGLIKIDAKAA